MHRSMAFAKRASEVAPEFRRSQERLFSRELVEGILCGQAIPVTVTDLLEKNCLIFVENERRRIGRLMRGIPT